MNTAEYGTIVRNILSEINISHVELVEVGLLLEHHSHLEDCLEHPENLNLILKKLFGDDHAVILDEIHHRLSTHSTKPHPYNPFVKNHLSNLSF